MRRINKPEDYLTPKDAAEELREAYLLQIEAPHFCAGVELRGGVVVHAAPILKYMVGWDEARVRGYATRKGWRVTRALLEAERG